MMDVWFNSLWRSRAACRCTLVLVLCSFSGCDGVFQFSGTVVDGNGKPVSDATVEIQSDEGELFELKGKTDSQGTFWLETTVSPHSESFKVSLSVMHERFAPVRMRLPLGTRNENVEIEMSERGITAEPE